MIFIWLLLSPILSMLSDFVKPIAIIGVLIFVDHIFQLGFTNMAIEYAEAWLADYFKNQFL